MISINLDKKREKNRIKALSPSDFEVYIADLFRLYGYEAEVTPATNDGGKDIILKYDNRKYYVECKHFTDGAVGREIIQKLVGAGVVDGDVYGYIVATSSCFNDNALACMQKSTVPLFLLDLDDIVTLATDKETLSGSDLFLSEQEIEKSLERDFFKQFGRIDKYTSRVGAIYRVNDYSIKAVNRIGERTIEFSYCYNEEGDTTQYKTIAFMHGDNYLLICRDAYNNSSDNVVSFKFFDVPVWYTYGSDFGMAQLRRYVYSKI